MEVLINVNEFESQLRRCRLAQQGKEPQLLFLRAMEDHLETSVGMSDAVVSSFLRKGEFYSCRNAGSGKSDYQTASQTLSDLKDSGIVRLYARNELLYLSDLKGHRAMPLTRYPEQEFYPTAEAGRCPKVRLPSQHLLHGISQVRYALNQNGTCSLYDKIRLLVAKDQIIFTAGDGIRFARYELTGSMCQTGKQPTVIYLPMVIVGALVRNLRAEIGEYVTLYGNDKPRKGSPAALLVEAGDFRVYAKRPAGNYPNLGQLHLPSLSVAATLRLSSFESVIPVLRSGHRDHNSETARLSFDFRKGKATLVTNNSDVSLEAELALEPGTNTGGQMDSAVIQCRTRHLIEMYDWAEHAGNIVIRSAGTYGTDAALACQIEYPTTYLQEGVHGKYTMVFPQSSIW